MTFAIDITAACDALDAYRVQRGMTHASDEDVTDLIVDLLHLLDTHEGCDSANAVLSKVRRHYDEETNR